MRCLLCLVLAFTMGCVGFYRIQPEQLYRVTHNTRVRDHEGKEKTLRVAKVYATLNDGRKVAIRPQHAPDLFFDANLDETGDLELAVTNARYMRRSALVGCGVGLIASGAFGVAVSRSCEEEFIDGPGGGEFVDSNNCGVDFGEAISVLFGAGLYFCPLGSGLSVLWQRSNPVDVDVLPPGLATSR